MKLKDEYTTIALKKKTVSKLKSLGKKGETYDDIIKRLLEQKKKEKTTND